MHASATRHPLRSAPAVLAFGLLVAGACLRIFFLRHHAFLAGDSFLYQDIAQNWLYQHIYGLSTDAAPRPTLIRVPGYPAILAALAWVFDRFLQADPGTLRSFAPVLWLQVVADLLTCTLAAAMARRLAGRGAALATLTLGCLCPFTANYTAVPLTETFTLFFLMLALYALQLWLSRPSPAWLAVLAAALACGILLRPDQGLLLAAVLPVLLVQESRTAAQRLKAPVTCALLVALPFLPWTVRNYRTFHVLQPLASRLAIDPGETAPLGFQAWYRTWAIDFSSTEDAYWKYPEETVVLTDLPDRAFRSPQERAEVGALFQQAAATHRLDAAVEQQFANLARQRTASHPVQTHVWLPLARLFNMLLHPRTEMLPVSGRWWQYQLHPRQTVFAAVYGLWSLAYFAFGLAGLAYLLRTRSLPRGSRALLVCMLAYVGLRCALLLTLDNAEQRYTLEFFPLLLISAGTLFTRRGEPQP